MKCKYMVYNAEGPYHCSHVEIYDEYFDDTQDCFVSQACKYFQPWKEELVQDKLIDFKSEWLEMAKKLIVDNFQLAKEMCLVSLDQLEKKIDDYNRHSMKEKKK